ncbi:MAG: alpha/beta fold hydrolase [Acidimicrobiia bacterium]|nr:alpha/beta fold hydrolase [Acidimicrobiia bacterium]
MRRDLAGSRPDVGRDGRSLDLEGEVLGEVPEAPELGRPALGELHRLRVGDLHRVDQVPGDDPNRLAIVGHSYGGAIALMRASDDGASEPIVAVSAPVASKPVCCPLRPGDRYALDHAGAITGPVLVLHGDADLVVPAAQPEAFSAARPSTEARFYPAPAGHAFPWQAEQYPGKPAGTSFASQFLTDSVAWLKAQFP